MNDSSTDPSGPAKNCTRICASLRIMPIDSRCSARSPHRQLRLAPSRTVAARDTPGRARAPSHRAQSKSSRGSIPRPPSPASGRPMHEFPRGSWRSKPPPAAIVTDMLHQDVEGSRRRRRRFERPRSTPLLVPPRLGWARARRSDAVVTRLSATRPSVRCNRRVASAGQCPSSCRCPAPRSTGAKSTPRVQRRCRDDAADTPIAQRLLRPARAGAVERAVMRRERGRPFCRRASSSAWYRRSHCDAGW